MTRKCCLTCVYFCGLDRSTANQVILNHFQLADDEVTLQAQATCYHRKWQPFPLENEYGFDPSVIVDTEIDHSDIVDLHGNKLSLDTYLCDLFIPFEDRNTAPLDRIWQEHQQRMQEAKDRRRFWITTAILIATALAVGLSAFFDLLEWSRTP